MGKVGCHDGRKLRPRKQLGAALGMGMGGGGQPMARAAVLSPKESTGAPMRSSMET
jgi:hypothetical protein